MIRITLIIILFSYMMGCRAGAPGIVRANRNVDQDTVQSLFRKSIKLTTGSFNRKVENALLFIHENEPVIYCLLLKNVEIISCRGEYFWSRAHFPDEISLSTRALKRSIQHIASVIFHELNHILFFKIKLNTAGEDIEYFYSRQHMDLNAIKSSSALEEERLIRHLQLKFLIKHGNNKEVRMQMIIIENLEKTYRYLYK